MRSLFGELREHISGKGVRIVFPEGNDDPVSYTHLASAICLELVLSIFSRWNRLKIR